MPDAVLARPTGVGRALAGAETTAQLVWILAERLPGPEDGVQAEEDGSSDDRRARRLRSIGGVARIAGVSPMDWDLRADVAESATASGTMALRASPAPPPHCSASGAELAYLRRRGRPRRWCDAYPPPPSRLRPRATQAAGVPTATRPRRARVEIPPRDPAHVRPFALASARVPR